MTDSPASAEAVALLAELVAHGVRDVVIAPGSRSQALALAATALSRAGALRVHVRVDERVAGFTALGIARETRVPVAVMCTSGTAAGNLLPAAMEAFHAGVPLLLLTADRPPELRGVGANQATVQPGLFASFVRWGHDAPVPGDGSWRGLGARAVAAAVGNEGQGIAGVAGPVHLNLPCREPLSGPVEVSVASGEAPRRPEPAPTTLERGPRTVVIAGADAGPDAEAIAFAGGWPLIAEIVSGARFGRLLVHGYRMLLRDEQLGGRIERAVVLGHPTLSREVAALLARRDVDVVAVRSGGEALNLNGRTTAVQAVTVAPGETDREWLGAWMAASAAASVDLSPPAPDQEGLSSEDRAARLDAVRAELDVVRRPLDRELVADAVWRATWPHDRLVFGSSRLVRVADQVLGGKKVPVHANRGLAGIDGTIATATGIAVASQAGGAPGVTRVLLGDLAFLHDVGALMLPADEPRPRLQLIVGNDGGGTIFDGLEVAGSAAAEDLDRVFYTPQTVRLEELAAAYGWEYVRVTTRSALDQALTTPTGGTQIIEVPLPR
ncbi:MULTISPECIES: 2-succinyl-5-enolpyruvyl-6-hydroxy-3-cyclohexene-1-carboxylic-acid synthase [Microbacterium]|uniref:2-succinyl-5-enolpyruvyl-6-hydroxy-3- cyclohexene-1-carboxylic-acid synthase n=1 Tax=Microbacterium TaxID=33882 RepID=UPI00217CE87D|nr:MULTISPECIES: 2-succinyl-5-enolpyruvyl-6-hydroxy-3-cyclohexene-1-carboxylic-acid synthase [Microbacterium]UWF77221.1 2-succinyl-5-enolpyruvyl-6-hydroxy-3-cyclohexene-1-carboxylic-acid synthase [Microbacterium neungamense]WCM55377.1 2-succinyl-5-enolpyruvyl-6-hydroxy-3-cyclohexene-1-carboxylic-acid synthase [Microbacterium sp. EF45047]